jgi:hypothetical protein
VQLGFENHPADVGPEKSSGGIIWVQIGVCVSVVGPVSACPPVAGPLDRTSASKEKKDLQWQEALYERWDHNLWYPALGTRH